MTHDERIEAMARAICFFHAEPDSYGYHDADEPAWKFFIPHAMRAFEAADIKEMLGEAMEQTQMACYRCLQPDFDAIVREVMGK
jgi:hypothetical protein